MFTAGLAEPLRVDVEMQHPPKNGRGGTRENRSFSPHKTIGGIFQAFTDYFNKYGEISDSAIMKDKHTRRPQGFGFVTFADPAVVEVKKTAPKGDMQMQVKVEQITRKVFVGGIPPSFTEDELKEYFSSYDSIVEHQIMWDHSTRLSRGFDFVTFEDENIVEEIISEGRPHELGGKQVNRKIKIGIHSSDWN
uniref:RRM domain-containing protein n=1 Tax=Nelumbo nucifera TaxID=4432 RepID=A0A822ZGX6_NELNU|nr:TPA_asm: hypothetical protein HUJ06_002622 [Nelumbo nucifera]